MIGNISKSSGGGCKVRSSKTKKKRKRKRSGGIEFNFLKHMII